MTRDLALRFLEVAADGVESVRAAHAAPGLREAAHHMRSGCLAVGSGGGADGGRVASPG